MLRRDHPRGGDAREHNRGAKQPETAHVTHAWYPSNERATVETTTFVGRAFMARHALQD
jgi:hypothetical protein